MSAISTVSLEQALGVWSELEQAYYGDNGFGSDTAEIYAYRLMKYTPTALHCHHRGISLDSDPLVREEMVNAAQALRDLLTHFAAFRECTIEVDGQPLARFDATEPFVHRCHVRVSHHREDEPR